ncbi:hypothetical protein [Halobacterium zhouii]|uniref:DUF7857 domain-containing protein n=1 Tax=Halobacterium zhouii TaxID=2902624 RepID=UPI001E557F57|nr:hypothetical protein [Halobacterium zhouii]
MRLETEAFRRGGVTLVAARVTNDSDDPRRVRVADRCGGSVLPPRTNGLPIAGWDDGGWEGVVDAGETRPVGYATRAPPTDPPADVVWSERAASDPTPAATLDDLGDPRPPRDAVTPPATDLPDGVREWLDGVSRRASDGENTRRDREGLRALAARTSVLRESVGGEEAAAAEAGRGEGRESRRDG